MGMFYYYIDSHITDGEVAVCEGYPFDDIPGLSTVYIRAPWSLFEPQENVFDWSAIDTAIQKYGGVGKQIALSAVVCEGSNYATPLWVYEAGAAAPDFNDPVFAHKLENFVRAYGAKYDGNRNIAFIDVGGEEDMYARYFPNTQRITSGSTYNTEPVVLTTEDWADPADTIPLIDTLHAGYLGLRGDIGLMYQETPGFFETVGKRLGYRLIPSKILLPTAVIAHGYFDMTVDWKNVGAAPCYKDAYPTLTLKNKDGDIVLVLTDRDFNVKDLPVGEPGKAPPSVVESVTFRAGSLLPGGEYDVFLSVGELDGTPSIAMPIDGDDGEKRYYVGTMIVQGMYDVNSWQNMLSTLRMNFTIRPTLQSYSYYITAGRLLCVETGVRNRHHEFVIDLPSQSLREGFAEKKPFSMEIDLPIPDNYFDKPLQDPAVLKGKRFNVWLEILNNTSGPENINYMTADRGRNSYLGVIELNDDMKWVFTPGRTPE